MKRGERNHEKRRGRTAGRKSTRLDNHEKEKNKFQRGSSVSIAAVGTMAGVVRNGASRELGSYLGQTVGLTRG